MPIDKRLEESEVNRAFLVYVNEEEEDDEYVQAELEGLCEASGVQPVGYIRQRISKPTSATFIGKGKLEELQMAVRHENPDLVIFDCELSGIQMRNISETINKQVNDRTQLILDIFAQRARTKEGQLQVELAQYSYMMPRLMSFYTKFERQKGGIGMRGPGETKLEADRRMVQKRIAKLTRDIEEVKKQRDQLRTSRLKNPFPSGAIVGYTSAGKSTLMNRLSGTTLLADDMPFATLDPTTRKVELEDGYSVFLTDTVGFIRNLPTGLIAAFRATLEETLHADFILFLIDVSTPYWDVQRDAVFETLEALEALEIPSLMVFNKIDRIHPSVSLKELQEEWPNSVAISALTGLEMGQLQGALKDFVRQYLNLVEVLIPYSESNLVDACYKYGRVIQKEFRDDGIYLETEIVDGLLHKLEKYILS